MRQGDVDAVCPRDPGERVRDRREGREEGYGDG